MELKEIFCIECLLEMSALCVHNGEHFVLNLELRHTRITEVWAVALPFRRLKRNFANRLGSFGLCPAEDVLAQVTAEGLAHAAHRSHLNPLSFESAAYNRGF
jgi:hypothetical protein